MTAVLDRPSATPEALIEEARGRQRQRRVLVGFLALLVGAVLALPVVAGDGSASGGERFGDRVGPLNQRLTTAPGPPLHTFTTVLYSGSRYIDTDPRAGQVNDAYRDGLDRLTTTFRAMLTTRSIIRQAITRSGVRRSVDHVVLGTKATTPPATNLIEVSVTDRRGETARRLANAIAEVFVEQINSIGPSSPRTDQLVSVYEFARERP